MKFFKFLTLGGAIASLIALVACSNKEEEPGTDSGYDEEYYASNATLSSDNDNFSSTDEGYAIWFAAEGGSATINVDCGCEWTAGTEADWLTIEYGESSSIVLTADSAEEEASEDSSSRAASVTFRTAGSGVEFCPLAVTQLFVEDSEYGTYGLSALASEDGSDFASAEISSTCPVELTSTSGCATVDEILAEYGNPATTGYLEYRAGTTYATTLTPLDAGATWITENFLAYSSWNDTELFGNTEEDGITFSAGTSYTSDGISYPSVDIKCIDAFPERTDFFYIVYRTSAGNAVAILFLYPGEAEEPEEPEGSPFFAVEGTTQESLEVADTYTGDYETEIGNILAKYNVGGVGYIEYTVGTSYAVGLKNTTDEDEWAAEPSASYDYFGYSLSDQTDIYSIEGGQTALYDGSTYPATGLTLNSDPECLFYLVWNDGAYDYILFFYNDTPPVKYGLEAVYATDGFAGGGYTAIDIATECPANIASTEDNKTVEEIIASYGNPYNVGYLKYTTVKDYKFTVTPKETNADWIVENYDAFDSKGNSLSSETYTDILAVSTSADENASMSYGKYPGGYPGIFLLTSKALPEGTDFIYFAVKKESGDEDAVALLFFYTTAAGDYSAYLAMDPMILEYTITDEAIAEAGEDGVKVQVPLSATKSSSDKTGRFECLIDWGDGSAYEELTQDDGDKPAHQYMSAGTFDAKVYGSATSLYGYSPANKTALTAVKSWGDLGLTSMYYAFRDQQGLTSLPSDNSGIRNVTNFNYAFMNCYALTSLPNGLFAGCDQATNFGYAFQNCTGLISVPSDTFKGCTAATGFSGLFCGGTSYQLQISEIPEGLFDDCTAATDFGSAFSYCNITAVPGNLFKNCPAVTSFANMFKGCSALTTVSEDIFKGTFANLTNASSLFYGCTSLSTVPSGIFDNFTAVTNFSSLFYGSTSLTSVPTGLFDNCTVVTNFSSLFNGCTALSCESPYTVIGSDSVHLYQRSDHTDYFTAPTSYSNAFKSCSSLTDYNSIPSNWGGGAN